MPYVCLYTSYLTSLAPYTDSQLGRLVRAMLAYGAAGEEPAFRGCERLIWPMLKDQLDRDKERYRQRCEQNRANGAKGGRPKNPSVIPETEGFSEKPKKPKEKENEKEKEKEKENENKKEKENEKENEIENENEKENEKEKENGTDVFFRASPVLVCYLFPQCGRFRSRFPKQSFLRFLEKSFPHRIAKIRRLWYTDRNKARIGFAWLANWNLAASPN